MKVNQPEVRMSLLGKMGEAVRGRADAVAKDKENPWHARVAAWHARRNVFVLISLLAGSWLLMEIPDPLGPWEEGFLGTFVVTPVTLELLSRANALREAAQQAVVDAWRWFTGLIGRAWRWFAARAFGRSDSRSDA